MAEDTAVLEVQGTADTSAATETVTPSPEAAPAPPTETESTQSTTETGDAPEEPYVSPFAGKTPEEMLKDPEVQKLLKGEEAKLNESFRQREENARKAAADEAEARQHQVRVAESQRMVAGRAMARINGIIQKVEQGDYHDAQGNDLRPGWSQKLALDMADATFVDQSTLIFSVMQAGLNARYPDSKGSEGWTKAERALRQYLGNGDAMSVMNAVIDAVADAVRTGETPKLTEQVLAGLKKKAADDAELDKQAKASAARDERAGNSPSRGGLNGGSRSAQRILDTADPLSKEYAAAYEEEFGHKLKV